jgi:flagellar biogenesis protein FliO
MGPATEEGPKESGLPSLRAVGFMALFIALVLVAIYFVTR